MATLTELKYLFSVSVIKGLMLQTLMNMLNMTRMGCMVVMCVNPIVRGLLQVENITYGIEPMDSSSDLKHIIYRMENVKKESMMCGVNNTETEREHTEDEHPSTMTQFLRVSRLVSSLHCSVELLL